MGAALQCGKVVTLCEILNSQQLEIAERKFILKSDAQISANDKKWYQGKDGLY